MSQTRFLGRRQSLLFAVLMLPVLAVVGTVVALNISDAAYRRERAALALATQTAPTPAAFEQAWTARLR